MHGAGNDYVYINCFQEPLPENPAELARRISNRHFGVGGDGLVLICPSDVADARMRMFNIDGSESEMCGNAVRCVAKYVYDHNICRKETLKIETGRGVLSLRLILVDDKVQRVRVDMGEPILNAEKIPTTLRSNQSLTHHEVTDVNLQVADQRLKVTCVSMGNPHCITFVDEINDALVHGIGAKVEVDPHFPKRTNVEFVRVISPTEVQMRVWERGCGETLACGTGACAVCVAGSLTHRTQKKITVHLPGGDLEIDWASDSHVYMTGEAVEVFSGTWNDERS
jgi:diaminopimelate epimerase